MEENKIFEVFQNISDRFSNLRKNLQARFSKLNPTSLEHIFAAFFEVLKISCFFSDFGQKLPDFAENFQLRRHIFIYRVWDFFKGKKQENYFL